MVVHESDRVIVLEPVHDLYEGGECDAMESALIRLAEEGARVVVDVSRVPHLSARCLGILARAYELASRNGGQVAVCGVTRVHRWLLAKTGLAGVIAIHDDVAAALSRMNAPPAVA